MTVRGRSMAWAPEGRGASRSQLAEGTRCLPCSARGHFCAAHEIIGGRAVCLCCLDGVDCPKTPRNGVAVARTMSSAEREEQRRSFAHGNVGMSNPDVTRAVIDKAAATLAAEDPAAHTMPQPALASGAVPSVDLPPRRVFLQAAKKMCLSCRRLNHSCVCVCSRGCGKPRHRGACKGVVFGKAFPKAIAAGLSNAEAREMVALAEEITAGVDLEVKQRGAKDGATVTERAGKAKGIFGALEKEHAVFPVDPPVSVSLGVQVSAVATLAADEWTWVDLDAVPDYRKRSVYDAAVRLLRDAPVGKVMTKTFATADVAHTYVKGISRRAKDAGLVVGRTMEGSTIYLWRKA